MLRMMLLKTSVLQMKCKTSTQCIRRVSNVAYVSERTVSSAAFVVIHYIGTPQFVRGGRDVISYNEGRCTRVVKRCDRTNPGVFTTKLAIPFNYVSNHFLILLVSLSECIFILHYDVFSWGGADFPPPGPDYPQMAT